MKRLSPHLGSDPLEIQNTGLRPNWANFWALQGSSSEFDTSSQPTASLTSNKSGMSAGTTGGGIRHVKFITGSEWIGEWDRIGMSGMGMYKMPHGVIYEGTMKNGLFEGIGVLKYPNGSFLEGLWYKGRLKYWQFDYADGLERDCHDWSYCTMPDRRFFAEHVVGFRPANTEQLSNEHPAREVPPGHYDVGQGFYNPKTHCIVDAITGEVISIPTASEEKWILARCRRAEPSETVGYRPDLYENWFRKPVTQKTPSEQRSEGSESTDEDGTDTYLEHSKEQLIHSVLSGKVCSRTQLERDNLLQSVILDMSNVESELMIPRSQTSASEGPQADTDFKLKSLRALYSEVAIQSPDMNLEKLQAQLSVSRQVDTEPGPRSRESIVSQLPRAEPETRLKSSITPATDTVQNEPDIDLKDVGDSSDTHQVVTEAERRKSASTESQYVSNEHTLQYEQDKELRSYSTQTHMSDTHQVERGIKLTSLRTIISDASQDERLARLKSLHTVLSLVAEDEADLSIEGRLSAIAESPEKEAGTRLKSLRSVMAESPQTECNKHSKDMKTFVSEGGGSASETQVHDSSNVPQVESDTTLKNAEKEILALLLQEGGKLMPMSPPVSTHGKFSLQEKLGEPEQLKAASFEGMLKKLLKGMESQKQTAKTSEDSARKTDTMSNESNLITLSQIISNYADPTYRKKTGSSSLGSGVVLEQFKMIGFLPSFSLTTTKQCPYLGIRSPAGTGSHKSMPSGSNVVDVSSVKDTFSQKSKLEESEIIATNYETSEHNDE